MKKILIANRGEIAVRVVRACRDAALTSVAVYADPDADALHVRLADEAYSLDGTASEDTYLDGERLIEIAARAGADAVHPGYGFLSENADFAQAVIDAGLCWIGPTPQAIRDLGNKVTARAIAVQAGAPLVPGSDGPVADADAVRVFAEEHGLPVAIKAAFGGGGRGMRIAREMDDIDDAFESAVRESTAAFGRGECFVERFLDKPRHVEAQILADTHGNIIVLGTRDCSLQRRNQKLVEEAPAPFLSDDQRERIHESARDICRQAGYTGAGTVEYLVAPDGVISFLEVNTRLQVEHPVTEQITGVDIVAQQFRIADGLEVEPKHDPAPVGHAFEFRLNAEDPAQGFLPCPGTIEVFEAPTGAGIRVDSGVQSGSIVPDAYDSLMAKLIVTGADRAQALRRATSALDEMVIRGVPTVLAFHRAVVRDPAFIADDQLGVHTTWIENDFHETLAASSELAAAAPGAARKRLTIDIDGKSVQLGLPERLLTALIEGRVTGDANGGAPENDEAADDTALVAPINGTLVKWLTEDGAAVEAGDGVAVLEAMKMETKVNAHRAGQLERGKPQAGDRVERGDALAHIA